MGFERATLGEARPLLEVHRPPQTLGPCHIYYLVIYSTSQHQPIWQLGSAGQVRFVDGGVGEVGNAVNHPGGSS